MLIGGYKHSKNRSSSVSIDQKPDHPWKTRRYPVPVPSRRRIQWKASALRSLQPWMSSSATAHPVTVMVPALYNFLPAEVVAMGWLNEIDALGTIRQRMNCASKVTGWDVFTFHTLHNLDPYFDSTITTVRETWVKEGNLSREAVQEAKRRFARTYDYHRVPARLVENLVFQSSLIDWFTRHASDVPLRFHVIGTALLSALVSSGAVSFEAAVKSALKFGGRWDETLCSLADAQTEEEVGWSRFELVRGLLEGSSSLSLAVAREDLPPVTTPAMSFWYSSTPKEPPVLISTAQDAAAALETLNMASWSCAVPKAGDERIRGFLVSPLHPMSRACKWSVSNFLLATPAASTLFLDNIATLGRIPIVLMPEKAIQNRFRLSRTKVTGP